MRNLSECSNCKQWAKLSAVTTPIPNESAQPNTREGSEILNGWTELFFLCGLISTAQRNVAGPDSNEEWSPQSEFNPVPCKFVRVLKLQPECEAHCNEKAQSSQECSTPYDEVYVYTRYHIIQFYIFSLTYTVCFGQCSPIKCCPHKETLRYQYTRQETQRQPGVVAVTIDKASRVLYNIYNRSWTAWSHPDVMTVCMWRTCKRNNEVLHIQTVITYLCDQAVQSSL